MTESKRRNVTRSTDKSPTNYEDILESDEDHKLNLLSHRDRNKVIHEYNLKKPQPTIKALATKYKVTCRHISDIIRRQKSILMADRNAEEDACNRMSTQRDEQIIFLDLVMYEYLQRTLYHNIHVDQTAFQLKAAEVIDCMAILKFKPSYAWFINFKKKFGIEDISREALLREIKPKEVKRRSLQPVDMVLHVQQRKDDFLKIQKTRDTRSSVTKNSELSGGYIVDKEQLRKNNKPKVVYESVDEDERDSGDIGIDGTTLKIEVSPTEVSDYTGPHPSTPKNNRKNNGNQRASSVDKLTLKENSPNSDTHTLKLIMPSSPGSEDDEFLTIYEIVDDEVAPTSPAADNNRCSSPDLSNNEIDLEKTGDSMTIKTEPQSNEDESMETNDKEISTYILPNDIIKTEMSPSSQLDEEDIKPTIISEGNVVENNNSTNHHQHSSSLIDEHQLYPSRNLLDTLLDKAIFEKNEEMLMENGANNHHQSSNRKRLHTSSDLPDIETLEEAMRYLKVLENYVMLKENFRAIGLITQLEEAIKKPSKE